MKFWWWFEGSQTIQATPLTEINLSNNLTITYDMLTGILQEAKIQTRFYGYYSDAQFNSTMNYHIIQSDQSDFADFLDEYKWYLVGLGGVIVIAVVVVITVTVKKRN